MKPRKAVVRTSRRPNDLILKIMVRARTASGVGIP